MGYAYGNGYGRGYGYGYGPTVVYSGRRGYRMGALDLKVRPKNTEVYVDGQYVGLAKQYDGFPGHLWLESGVYEVAFYRPGFETQIRTVKILTELILDLKVGMVPGEAVRPEFQLAPPAREDEGDEVTYFPGRSGEQDEGRLHVAVHPSNAQVYLDGRMLGTGQELASLHAGLVLPAGTHTLEIVREGFESAERELLVESGKDLEFRLALKPLGYSTR